jgi:hypothetical protein
MFVFGEEYKFEIIFQPSCSQPISENGRLAMEQGLSSSHDKRYG